MNTPSVDDLASRYHLQAGLLGWGYLQMDVSCTRYNSHETFFRALVRQ